MLESKIRKYLKKERIDEGKITNDDVRDRIEMEGFHYTFTNYFNPKSFEDKKLQSLVMKYIKAAEDIGKYLELPY